MGSLSGDATKRLFAALEARAEWDIRWRGGEIDRLADEAHVALASAVAAQLEERGWAALSEVTFMRYGERGSFDMLAARAAERVAAMFEFKSEVTSSEETERRFDVKQRVVASVVEERFGWRPTSVGAFLVVTDTTANRDRMTRLSVMRRRFPAGTRAVREWLSKPSGSLSGLWFVRITHPRTGMRGRGGSRRVRKAN